MTDFEKWYDENYLNLCYTAEENGLVYFQKCDLKTAYEAGAEGAEGYERIVKDMQERGFNTYMSVKDFLQAHEELQKRNKQLELIILGNQEEIAELQKNYNKQKEINHELVDDVAAMQARIEELKNQIRQIYQGEAQDLRSRFPC